MYRTEFLPNIDNPHRSLEGFLEQRGRFIDPYTASKILQHAAFLGTTQAAAILSDMQSEPHKVGHHLNAAPCVRELADFTVGDEVFFRQPDSPSLWTPKRVLLLDTENDYIVLEPDKKQGILSYVRPVYPGLFGKEDFNTIFGRTKQGSGNPGPMTCIRTALELGAFSVETEIEPEVQETNRQQYTQLSRFIIRSCNSPTTKTFKKHLRTKTRHSAL